MVSDAVEEVLVHRASSLIVRVRVLLQAVQEDRRRARDALDALKLKVPIFGTLFHKTALSRFSSTLAMLLRSGVPILQALDIVADTVNNKVIVEGGRSTCRRASARASRSPSRCASTRSSRRWSCRCSRSARRPARSTRCSRRSRQFYDQEVEAAVDALTSLIEPLLIAIIGGAVGRRGHRPLHADVQHHQADQVRPRT